MDSSGNAVSCGFRAVALLLAATQTATAAYPTEYELKAAFLFNVLRFVHRQDAAPGRPLTLGLYAADTLEKSLRPLENSAVQGRRLRLRTVNSEADLLDCDVVFFGRSTGKTAALLERSVAAGLLAVGNDEGALRLGAKLALVVESRRVVLLLNEDVPLSGWVISSYLREVARPVKGRAL